MAYKMVEDSEGRLYVKTRWEEKLLLFVFSEDGTYLDAIYDKKYESHPANEMCFGEDGYLYVLGSEIIQVDSTSFMVSKAFSYATKDMIAAADLLYPIEEDSFYLFGYDGVFRITLGEEASEKILAPYEKDIFEEGARSYAISKDMLVVVNYKEWGITITYLTF